MDRVAGVGFSQKIDSFEAGRDCALNLIQYMGGGFPNVVLVVCTIHYKNFGGFKKLLLGLNSVFGNKVKIIGGTVAGFIIPQGCFTRGVSAFGLTSSDFDFSIAVAKDVKKNPLKAAQLCSKKIKEDLEKSKYKNKFLLNLPSGTTIPKIPGVSDNIKVIRSVFFSKLISKFLHFGTWLSLTFLQKGPGREEVIIDTLSQELSDYKIIGGSFTDDNRGFFNYQFVDLNVYSNTLIVFGISLNQKIYVSSGFGLTRRTNNFRITKKSFFDYIIEEINGKNAFFEILSILNWPRHFIENDARFYRRTFYVPIGYYDNGKLFTSVMGGVYGDEIVVIPKVKCAEACIMGASGKDLIDVVSSNLAGIKNEVIEFGIITSCIVRLETLGHHIYKVHEKLLNRFNNKPFIEIFVMGEDVYTKEIGARRIANSYNLAVFYEGGVKNEGS